MCRAFFIPAPIDKNLNIWTIDLSAFRKGIDMKKTYGGIGGGVGLLFLGGLFSALVIAVIATQDKSQDNSGFAGLVVFMAIAALVFIILGIDLIRRGLTSKKVDKQGKKGTCVVEHIDCYGTRFGPSIWMKVSFKGEDGEMHEHSARIDNEILNKVSKGMILRCMILGDKCYVDVNNLEIVKDEDIKEDLAA